MKPFLLTAPLLLASCATLPEPTGGGDNLPNAAAGPFRALSASGQVIDAMGVLHDPAPELGTDSAPRSPPYGIDDARDFGRDITVIRADDTPGSLAVIAYVAAAATHNGVVPTATTSTSTLVRYDALDGRTFGFMSEVVLQADATWEDGILGSPSAVRSGGEVFLYYEAVGGIGLAKSADGHAFTKLPAPILAPLDGGWEQGAGPRAPGVVVLPDGTFRMFYAVSTAPGATSIGEASSPDGATWTRIGAGPALAPAGLGNDGGGAPADAGDEPWDSVSVGSPFPVLATTGDGRSVLRLYYGARDSRGQGTVGLAARYGTDGPLERAVSAVFGTAKPLDLREPCVVAFTGFTLLYATATEMTSQSDLHPAIAVGVAPATVVLPAPM